MDGLLNQTPPIPLHALGAMLAIMLGAAQLSMKKGGAVHMLLGRVWVGLMLVVAGSSFFIHEIRLWGEYSPIHLLSLWTIWSAGLAVYYVRVSNIRRHIQVMIALYCLGLVLTELFTLWPGRVMHQLLFR